MSICHAEHRIEALPPEPRLLEEVTVRLVATEADRRRHDERLVQEHSLHNANFGGGG